MEQKSEWQIKAEEDAIKIVSDIARHVNSFSNKSENFNSAMSREHRTLQQSFTKLCFKWIEYCASDNYRFDGRNEQSHEVSRQLLEMWQVKNPGCKISDFLGMI